MDLFHLHIITIFYINSLISDKIVIIYGARQVGKTTLAEEIIKECADIANFAMMIADKFSNNYGK